MISVKKMIQVRFRNIVKRAYYSFKLFPYYTYWFKKDVKNSNLFDTEKNDMTGLLVAGHVIEKGLTMPEGRLGFGYPRIRDLISRCKVFVKKYPCENIEIQAAINDLAQYLKLHELNNFDLPEDISKDIKELLVYQKYPIRDCQTVSKDDFFKETNNFFDFAHQRHTVRWYSDSEIDSKELVDAIELATTAPSACNKQSIKVYVIKTPNLKKEVLNIHTGNRGWGHNANKLLLLTSDMNCWNFQFRTSAFLDGGIFTQNLLYALHYHKIAACTMNAELSPKSIEKLRCLIGFKQTEIPIVFIAIGIPPATFKYAGSQRINLEKIYEFK